MTEQMIKAVAPTLAAVLAMVSLAACGGGGGSTTGGAVAGAPAATSTPTPTPSATGGNQLLIANSTLTLGLQPPAAYAVLGYRVQGADAGFGYTLDRSSVDGSSHFGLRLAGPADLRLAIDGLGEASIVEGGGGGYTSDGFITQILGRALGGYVALGVLYGPQAKPLRAAAFVSFITGPHPNRSFPYDLTAFVYGIATPSADLPRSGTVRYIGLSEATALDLDFGTGAVSGSLSITDNFLLTLSEASLSPDRTTITGHAASADGLRSGTFEARLVGPGGSELMYRLVGDAGSLLEPEVGGLVRAGD